MNHPTRIIAIRHGETAWNVDTRIQGHLDIPLNERGHWQAQRMAQALAYEEIAAVYASDLSRAFETGRYLAHTAGAPITPDTGLRERGFGLFEGRTFKEIESELPEQAQRWRKRDPHFAPEGGESLVQLFDRVVDTCQRLAALHPGQQIALVGHGGVLDALYRAATRQDLQAPRTWELGNAAINRLLWSPQGFALVGWGDVAHLDQSPQNDGLVS
jgi:probable phosphoglycerate mutase